MDWDTFWAGVHCFGEGCLSSLASRLRTDLGKDLGISWYNQIIRDWYKEISTLNPKALNPRP